MNTRTTKTSVTKRFLRFLFYLKKGQKTNLTTIFYLQLWYKVFFFVYTVSKFNTPKSYGTDFFVRAIYVFLFIFKFRFLFCNFGVHFLYQYGELFFTFFSCRCIYVKCCLALISNACNYNSNSFGRFSKRTNHAIFFHRVCSFTSNANRIYAWYTICSYI